MRLVIVRAGAAGLRLIGCAHDSFMIEAPIDEIEPDVAGCRRSCGRPRATCSAVLSCARTASPSGDIVRYPARFIDKREMEDGMRHWNRLMALIGNDTGKRGSGMIRNIDAGKLDIDPGEMEEVLEGRPSTKRSSGSRARPIYRRSAALRDRRLPVDRRPCCPGGGALYFPPRLCLPPPDGDASQRRNLELDIDRRRKREALARLQNAGSDQGAKSVGHTARITLLWRPGRPGAE